MSSHEDTMQFFRVKQEAMAKLDEWYSAYLAQHPIPNGAIVHESLQQWTWGLRDYVQKLDVHINTLSDEDKETMFNRSISILHEKCKEVIGVMETSCRSLEAANPRLAARQQIADEIGTVVQSMLGLDTIIGYFEQNVGFFSTTARGT